jgi:hypothetical protein
MSDYTHLARAVNALLYEHWDPLALTGLAPRSEYESYVPPLIRLALGDDVEMACEAIALHLAQIESREMSLTLSAPAHRYAVAEQIVAVVRASGWTGAA